MPNPLYTYILNVYDLLWLNFLEYQTLTVIVVALFGSIDKNREKGIELNKYINKEQ